MLTAIIAAILRLLQLALFVRALLSWFPDLPLPRLREFLELLTEPLLSPVRRMLDRSRFFGQLPIDVSFLVVMAALEIVEAIL